MYVSAYRERYVQIHIHNCSLYVCVENNPAVMVWRINGPRLAQIVII